MSLQKMIARELARLAEPPLMPTDLDLAVLEAKVRESLGRK